MITLRNKLQKYKFLIIVIFLGAFLRFYNLDWGDGLFYHPDEYHIVYAVKRITFPYNLNPGLFSYGSVNVYTLYSLSKILPFEETTSNLFLIGRGISALYSTATLVVLFAISQKVFRKLHYSLLTVFLSALTPGLIQQAHFLTPESTLTFWLSLTIFLWLHFVDKRKVKYLIYASITIGIALGTKIVALAFLPIHLFMSFWFISNPLSKSLTRSALLSIILLMFVSLTFFIVFPYSVLDYEGFRHSMNYETGLGRGLQVVFYTRQFIKTVPFYFQFTKILPYTLGIPLLIMGSIGQFISLKSMKRNKLTIMLASFTIFFFSNSILFTKWTRFIAPSFFFWSFFCVYFITTLKNKRIRSALTIFVITTSIIWCYMFMIIYKKPDVRSVANEWIVNNINYDQAILTESGNMIEVPFTGNFQKKSFDFYNLDNDKKTQFELIKELERADYFIVQSRRVYSNHMRLPEIYPFTARFYFKLLNGDLGFTPIKEFTSYPEISVLNKSLYEIKDDRAEETWTVFDHPRIIIFKKTKPLNHMDYNNLLLQL